LPLTSDSSGLHSLQYNFTFLRSTPRGESQGRFCQMTSREKKYDEGQ
jgi:hypothetical protein